MTPRLDPFHQHGVDGAGRRRCLSGLPLSSGRAPHHHKGGSWMRLPWQHDVGSNALSAASVPVIPTPPSNVFKAVGFFFRFPRPLFPPTVSAFVPRAPRLAVNGLSEKLPFVFSVLSSPSLRCCQTPNSAPPALSHRQMCVLPSVVRVADVCEANVMVTAVMWRQSDDRNVKKHVFVRWVYVCLFASVQLEMPDSFGLKVNVYLYKKQKI